MKKGSLLLTAALLVLFSACKKKVDVNNYHPVVKTTGVEVLADGSVKVSGEVISAGNTDLVLAGFCMDTIPNPDLLSNQKSVDTLFGNTFSYTYTNLDGGRKYFFRAWVANEEGYAAGGDVRLDSIHVDQSFVPCTPPQDSIIYSHPQRTKKEKYYSISKVYYLSEWRIDLTSNSNSIYFEFSQKPTNGIYKTFENVDGANLVTIMVDGYRVQSGANVYVKQINSGQIEVTICEAKVYNGAFTDSISTRFTASY